MKRHSGILAAGLAALLALGACSTTQPAAKQVDDASIHAALKTKLTADRFSNITNVDVNVTNGVVTLAGEVPNPGQGRGRTRGPDHGWRREGDQRSQVKSPPTS